MDGQEYVIECATCGKVKRWGAFQHIHEMKLSRQTHRDLLFIERKYTECPQCARERAVAEMDSYAGL